MADDLDTRLDKLEKQLQRVADIQAPLLGSQMAGQSDEIDLRELWNILWQGKWWIIGITFLFAIAGVLYALSLPNMYKSEGIYAPAQKQGGSALGGQLGGLASLAGVSLGGGENNDLDQAIALITSWPFLESVFDKHELKPLIMGVKGWNRQTGELIWNEDVYDPVNNKWLREPPPGKQAEPSSYEVYDVFSKMISASFDTKTSMLNLSVEYYSPEVAKEWVDLLVLNINETFRVRDINEAKKNIAYLEDKINQTSIAEMQKVFYGMVEGQMKTLMLAEVDDEYLIKRVVTPKVAEKKSKPAKALICVSFVVLGAFLSVLIVLTHGLFSRYAKHL